MPNPWPADREFSIAIDINRGFGYPSIAMLTDK
jgi:hypothetical protein